MYESHELPLHIHFQSSGDAAGAPANISQFNKKLSPLKTVCKINVSNVLPASACSYHILKFWEFFNIKFFWKRFLQRNSKQQIISNYTSPANAVMFQQKEIFNSIFFHIYIFSFMLLSSQI